MTKKPKVIVCGAGIGGLTVAHELSKRNFDVTIYERHNIVGGLARSKYYISKNKKYPVEYSWRVYGTDYKNLLRVIGEIPLRKKKTKTVMDNLVKVCAYIFPVFGKEKIVLSHHSDRSTLIKHFSAVDKFKMLDIILYSLTMSTDRMNSLDHIRWKDCCNDLSPEARKYMVQLWGPVLGMDTTCMSFPTVARMIGLLLGGYVNSASCLFLMNQPTNDGWFDEWADYLQKKNVKIKTSHEIQDFKMKDGKISGVVVKGDKTFEDQADYYVCGLSVEVIAKIVSKNKELSKTKLKDTIMLAKKGRQIQLSVQIFLDQKIIYPVKDKMILYLPDTPWSLIIEPEDRAWNDLYCTDKRVKAILCVGICQTDAPGIVYNKPFTKCTREEIQKEVWEQIIKSYEMSDIKTEKGETIDKANIVLFYMWDSFKFDKGKMDVSEPKFSNNVNSLKYQPENLTEIPNFLFATGYTKTDRYLYSMEAAAEAGTSCANEILKKNGSMDLTKIYPFKLSSILLKPLIVFDGILFKIGLPHISKLTLNNSIFLVLLYAVVIILSIVFSVVFLVKFLFIG